MNSTVKQILIWVFMITCLVFLWQVVVKTTGGSQEKNISLTQLLNDVTSRVFEVYPDSTVIYPGHGDDTVLGTERPHVSEWRERGW